MQSHRPFRYLTLFYGALVVVCAWIGTFGVCGQLAITEVMCSASTNLGATYVPRHSDFWELTNFGTNTIPLDDYVFSDSRGLFDGMPNLNFFLGKQIGPGESMMLVRSGAVVSNTASFRAWWGDANLPANLQIHFYPTPGFNDTREAVQLFHVTATSTTLVDRVEMYEAQPGSTFTYASETGAFGEVSVVGRHGAFKAVETDDIGSPGFAAGPVALSITGQPENVTVDAGTPATFSVQWQGLPKPQFQWRFNGAPIAGAIDSTLTILPALQTNAGTYSVTLSNDLVALDSANAVLEVNTNPSCARIVAPPADLSVYTNQTAIFRAAIRGYPLPSVQWQFNGTNIRNATNTTLVVPNVEFSAAGNYSIRVSNSSCTNTATAQLLVTRKPFLAVTETMAEPSTNTMTHGHDDWWELTNYDTNAVNLRDYRFNDYPGPSFEGVFVISNDVVIRPGESIIFARQMSPEAFKNWWGEENLPENVQIITYSGHNFDPATDSVFLWNAAALEADDRVASVDSFTSMDAFLTPLCGVGLWFDPLDEGTVYGMKSVLGERGAIRAVEADDIGSPGYITNHPPRLHSPRFKQIAPEPSGVKLTWSSRPGQRYTLQFKNALTNGPWASLSQHSATGLAVTVRDITATNAQQRFYRLEVIP